MPQDILWPMPGEAWRAASISHLADSHARRHAGGTVVGRGSRAPLLPATVTASAQIAAGPSGGAVLWADAAVLAPAGDALRCCEGCNLAQLGGSAQRREGWGGGADADAGKSGLIAALRSASSRRAPGPSPWLAPVTLQVGFALCSCIRPHRHHRLTTIIIHHRHHHLRRRRGWAGPEISEAALPSGLATWAEAQVAGGTCRAWTWRNM
jgi:hypothetical protein